MKSRRIAFASAFTTTLTFAATGFAQSSSPPSASSSAPAASSAPQTNIPPPFIRAADVGEDPQGDNVFTMRDGAVVRGRVTTIVGGQFVDVVTATGPVRLPWEQIASAVGPSFPGGYVAPQRGAYGESPTFFAPGSVARIPPSPTGEVRRPTATLAPEEGRVPVHFMGRSGLEIGMPWLEHVTSQGVTTDVIGRRMCDVPCTLYVLPGGFQFTVGGSGYRSQYQIVEVGPNGARVTLATTPRRNWYAGVSLAVSAGLNLVVGGALIGAGFSSSSPSMLYSGIGIAVTAFPLGVVGAFLIVLQTAHVEHTEQLGVGGMRVGFAPHADGGGSFFLTGHF